MNIIRQTISLTIVALVAAGIYAYQATSSEASTKIQSLMVDIEPLTGDPSRGEYVAFMGGCIACHTNYANNGKRLAGGVPFKTPFGTFYSPNITSDSSVGLGQWTTEDFLKAMSIGKTRNNEHYFPVYPYTSYSVMTAQDLIDLKAWLDRVEPVPIKPPSHKIAWPFSFRPMLMIWKSLYFDPLRTVDSADRGSYLVNGPGHCAECHSPRNLLGGIRNRSLTGNSRGPEGESVPGITSADLSAWSLEDLVLFLEVGIKLDGDFTGGHMVDVIEHSTGQLSGEDRTLIAQYLLSESNKP